MGDLDLSISAVPGLPFPRSPYSPRQLLELQPLHPHFSKEEEKTEGRLLSLRTLCGSCVCHLFTYSIGQKLIIWTHLPSGETSKCGFYSGWSRAKLKIRVLSSPKKERRLFRGELWIVSLPFPLSHLCRSIFHFSRSSQVHLQNKEFLLGRYIASPYDTLCQAVS